MRQLTLFANLSTSSQISKLPMRQLTQQIRCSPTGQISKLPMRQLTGRAGVLNFFLRF